MSQPKSNVLSVAEWNTKDIKYMAPKINAVGGKSVTIISTQTNRALSISSPAMMTWGLADFESDEKYSMAMNFPMEEYKRDSTDLFLKKLRDFEEHIIDDAFKNSELWFGSKTPREVLQYTFFPIVRYSKNKDTKQIDYSKSPSIRGKVSNYEGKWGIEVFDTNQNLIFPCDNPELTPMDFILKMSDVACVLSLSQLWFGGKGWGCTLKVVQCVVKLRDVVCMTTGRCNVLMDEDEEEHFRGQDNETDL